LSNRNLIQQMKKMIKKSWFFGNFSKTTNYSYSNDEDTPITLNDKDLTNVCNLMKVGKYKNMLIDAFKNKTIKLDTSEWFKD
jgi:hypothetical protein